MGETGPFGLVRLTLLSKRFLPRQRGLRSFAHVMPSVSSVYIHLWLSHRTLSFVCVDLTRTGLDVAEAIIQSRKYSCRKRQSLHYVMQPFVKRTVPPWKPFLNCVRLFMKSRASITSEALLCTVVLINTYCYL